MCAVGFAHQHGLFFIQTGIQAFQGFNDAQTDDVEVGGAFQCRKSGADSGVMQAVSNVFNRVYNGAIPVKNGGF